MKTMGAHELPKRLTTSFSVASYGAKSLVYLVIHGFG